MLKITMDIPSRDEELDLARRTLGDNAPERVLESGAVQPVLDGSQLEAMRAIAGQVLVGEELSAYAVDLVRKTREHPSVLVGAGPRATQSLVLASRVHAAMEERDFVTPDDMKALARAVLEHRVILRPEYEIEGLTAGEVVTDILQEVTVPR